MQVFFISLVATAVLLLVAAVGFLLMKRKTVSEECIPGFSRILLYVCQPCISVYSFYELERSRDTLASLGVFALLSFAVILIMLVVAWIFLHRKYGEPIYRIMTIATALANCSFFGIPIIEALMPEAASELTVYTVIFAVAMNIVGWTVGMVIIKNDPKYMSASKILLNPTTLGVIAALAIWGLGIRLPDELYSMIVTVGRMASPLSMLIMGMRLATVRLLPMLTDIRIYLTIAVKQFVMPLVALLLVLYLPIALPLKQTLYIIAAAPAASVVLNYAELLGEGQKEAASTVLLSTALSVITLPIMMLLLPVLG